MVSMAQSTTNWRNRHTHVDHIPSLTHLHQHSYNHCAKHQLSYYKSWNQIFIFEVPEGGSKPEYPEKTPDSLSAIIIGIT